MHVRMRVEQSAPRPIVSNRLVLPQFKPVDRLDVLQLGKDTPVFTGTMSDLAC
jgi:hypothetical protein